MGIWGYAPRRAGQDVSPPQYGTRHPTMVCEAPNMACDTLMWHTAPRVRMYRQLAIAPSR
eukprot:4855132-Prymnesium_polylepis.1